MSATGYDLITEEMLQELCARIETLKAVLREIVEVVNDDVSDEMKLDRVDIVARAALVAEQLA